MMDRSQLVPDCLTGAIMAMEGIGDAVTVLNGPTGCKFFHSTQSETQLHRDSTLDPLRYAKEFYFGQPRVPCTYLDDHDYIYGSMEKLKNIVPQVIRSRPSMVAIVNSPGAALIGDDLERTIAPSVDGIPAVTVETTGFSGSMADGFQLALLRVLDRICLQRGNRRKGRVNLVGMSIWHSNWRGSVDEVIRLLGLCGIEVNTTIGAGWSVEDIRASTTAEYNLVLHEEFADHIIEWYRREHGIPSFDPDSGAPIGFQATADWIHGACSYLGVDPSPALDEIDAMRSLAYREISRLNSMTGLPKGATFSIHAEGSLMLPLTKFLHGYLGMVPVALDPYPFRGECLGKLEEYLGEYGLGGVMGMSILEREADIALADGNTLAILDARGAIGHGLEVHIPNSKLISMIDRPLLGLKGTVELLELVLNALAYL